MTNTQRRIALLTGVSVAAMGVPAVAQAATTIEPSVPYINVAPFVTDSVNICVDLSPDADCFYGVFATGAGAVTAAVTQPSNGELDVVAFATLGDVNLSVVNTGVADVQAIAIATGQATANALVSNGLNVVGLAASDAFVNITNTAAAVLSIEAFALAKASAGTFALATATANGIVEVALAGSVAFAGMSNEGFIDVGAGAAAIGQGASANAVVDGVGQLAIGGSAAFADATNNNLIDVHANAVAIDTAAGAPALPGPTGAIANASADGLVQVAIGGTIAGAAYDNNGIIDVDATAIAIGPTFASANATVSYALSQVAIAGTLAVAVLQNSGTIEADAIAIAIGGTSAQAFADVDDVVVQLAIAGGGGAAVAQVTNDGLISGHAFAKASDAAATAMVGTVVQQTAIDGFAAVTVHNSTPNAAIIGVATATAFGPLGNATANADIGIIINQNAIGSTGAFASVTNVGLIAGVALANANAFAIASANATIVTGINQNATATGALTGTASAALGNSGTIVALAVANAGGTGTALAFIPATSAFANASVSGAGIDQFVSATGASAANALASITNTGGYISIGAIANASASVFASAYAEVATGIEQDASALAAGGVGDVAFATAALSNSGGVISIGALANAVATTSAIASAEVDTGIGQHAFASGFLAASANVSLLNSGFIGINATANAAATVFASAFAEVDVGIDQSATAASALAGATFANANVSLNNSGTIGIGALANAVATTSANASAEVDTGISQGAFASGFAFATANVSLTNSGTLLIHATANAAALGYASAVAEVDTGIYQSATASAPIASANISLTNSGTLGINAIANATALSTAYASASVDTGISQNASASGSTAAGASVSLANSGTLGIAAIANAAALSFATASAFVDTGISQNATAVATTFASATASLVNSGALGIIASANAAATFSAFAIAAVDTGISQNAFASASVANASASLNNSGSLVIAANAFASATAQAGAQAFVGTGIYQTAVAIGSALANADVSLTNSGSIDIVANATALAAGIFAPASGPAIIFGNATAIASVATGIYQDAFASAVTATVVPIVIGGTTIFTFFYGGDANASVSLTNTGSINVAAHALASANSAYASAFVDYGVEQGAAAIGGSDADATVTLTNALGATMNVGATATAVGTFAATASAHVDNGIEQDAFAFVASGLASADITLTNAGVIAIVADASADANGFGVFGTTIAGYASASAYIDNGIHQSAFALGFGIGTITHTAASNLFVTLIGNAEASVTLNNTGTIAIVADAYANGGTAIAFAGIGHGIDQNAIAYAATSANAYASLTNSATVAVLADATAIGTFLANATASIGTGIDQFASATAFGPANALVSLSNGGLIAVTVDAFASASNIAFAGAYINQGIGQSAFASGSAGTALAQLFNSGIIEISADASATGVSAVASATIGTGIQQGAYGNDLGLALLDNSGTILITAEADAGNAGTSTFAGAFALIDAGISQSATAFLTGGVATATLVNTGNILISADAAGALASDGSAIAVAVIGTGIYQHASASSAANVGLFNDGAIDVLAAASAIADEDGTAVAGIGHVVFQSASAYGTGGDASVSLVNNSELVGLANATVFAGNDVYVSAFVGAGVSQFAFGGTTGTANASLVNNGLIAFTADASGIGGGTGTALAFASGGFQIAAAGGGAAASIVNTATMLVAAEADIFVGNAAQKGASAVAVASALGWFQGAFASTLSFTATTNFTAAFTPAAVASDTISGVGFVTTQTITNTPSGPALAAFDNSGLVVITADASAAGDDQVFALANAIGFTQAAAGSSALASFVNGPAATATVGGTMVVAAHAFASGDNAGTAVAFADAVNQFASAASATLHSVFTGTGTIHFTGAGTTLSFANSSANLVISGSNTPTGHAVAALDNSGIINVAATATAIVNGNQGPVVQPTSSAFAAAVAQGIDQFARGATATAVIDNSGSLSVAAHALASGVTAAGAVAAATGISQFASAVAANFTSSFHLEAVTTTDIFGHTHVFQTFVQTDSSVSTTSVGAASVILTNSGTINVIATASAIAGTSAFAGAYAAGVLQGAAGTVASASVSNSGDINVLASANASGTTAFASATALGIGQFLAGTQMNATFINSGTLNVMAIASAVPPAYAAATGYFAGGAGGGTLSMNVLNTGDIVVAAGAYDPAGTATASALGIGVVNSPTFNGVTVVGAPVDGFVTNAGLLDVLAFASGGTLTTTTAGGVMNTFALSSANATGIYVASGINNMTITNSGLLLVDAVTVHGGPASATGILATGNGVTTPLLGDVLTINNSGDIIVRVSTDGGTTFHRGMAIDVATAPNNSVINLLGGANGTSLIYGNIDVQSGDLIHVTDGETIFNGIINPECMPAGGPTALVLDDPAQNLCGQGDLAIDTGGNLHLVIDPVDGPSYGFVNTFTVSNEGTIEYDLPGPGFGGTVPIGTYPQIFTEVANLDGTLIANIQAPANGLFDNTIYENVIDAIVRNGTFDQCIINGVPVNSLLVSADCIYDSQANVDIGIFRTAFDAVPGLNDNGTAVGSGLECIYDTHLTGGIADLLADLFLFTDPVNYNTALNNLAGEGYANYLQSFPSLGVHYNDLIDHATNCEVPALAGSILECRASAPFHLWGQLDYQWRKADGDSEAGTAKSKRFTGLIGVDANVGAAGIIGVSGGYVTNNTRTDRFNEKVDGNGWQVGAYGAYDPGQFYIKAVTTYSRFNGDSSRHIDFTGLAPGATFSGNTNGSPDVTMWTVGVHGGYRIGMGGNSVITPYLNYDYVNAKLKSFTESGLPGANLTVLGGRSKHSFLTGGIKYATQLGGVVPEVNLGYRYRFGKKESDFTAAFIGDTSCAFEVDSAVQKRGTFLAGLSVGGKMGPVDLRIGYEGEFNSDITSHSGNFKIVLPLGGHAAPPPPPPAPVIAPPPPPPPAPEMAPPPPPPPPAPVERGERGQ